MDTAPKQGNLVCIVDLHDVKLLDDLLVLNCLLLLEFWNDFFPEVNCDDVVQRVKCLNFFISLINDKKG